MRGIRGTPRLAREWDLWGENRTAVFQKPGHSVQGFFAVLLALWAIYVCSSVSDPAQSLRRVVVPAKGGALLMPSRHFRRHTLALSGLLLLTGSGLVLDATPVVGADGTGEHQGATVQISKEPRPAQSDQPCGYQRVEYTGAGNVALENSPNGRVTYSGPIMFKYVIEDSYADPNGTMEPDPDGDTTTPCSRSSSADGAIEEPAGSGKFRKYAPSKIASASIEGQNEGFSIKCQWDGSNRGTFQRPYKAAFQNLILPAGGFASPKEGDPGTCMIKPPVGKSRFSNTEVEGYGALSGACAGIPPTTCAYTFNLTATTPVNPPPPPEPPPLVTKIETGSMAQNSADKPVTVSGEEFDQGSQISFSGEGVSVNSVKFESLTKLTANISVAADAPVGKRDVTVTASDGTSGVCSACFEVLAGAAAGSPPPVAPPPPPPPPPAGDPPVILNQGNTGIGGGAGTGGSNVVSGSTSQPAPPPPAQSAAGPSSGGPNTPAPPPGTGGGVGGSPTLVPGGTLVPVQVPVHASAAMAAGAEEASLESAPQAGARILMVAPELGFLITGLMMLLGCFNSGRRGIKWPADAEPSVDPAVAVASARSR